MDVFSYLLGKSKGGVQPTGTINITENGTYDVTNYASAEVEVQSGIILPDGYTLVNYLESSGTQYIDTDYIPNTNTKIELKCLVLDTGGIVFGNRQPAEGGGDDIYYALGPASGKMTFFYNQRLRESSTIDTGNFVNFIVENDHVSFNAVDYNININIFPTDYSIILFGLNNAGVLSLSSVRIGRIKISENDTLVHDYIPCFRNSDSIAGMYDLVDETFLTNNGTGSFTYPPNYL